MKHSTSVLRSHDGTKLVAERWVPTDHVRAMIVIVQGRGEHVGRYAQTATDLVAAGYGVWAVDLRGQGRSAGRRGHIQDWRELLQDVHACVTAATEDDAAGGTRPFMLGHSLGGLLALHYATEHGPQLRGLMVSSPACGLAQPVPAWQEMAVRWLTRWWPTFIFQRRGDVRTLTHNVAIRTSFMADPLVHHRISARMYAELKRAMGRVAALVQQLRIPTLVLQAGDDRLVSIEATRAMYTSIGTSDKVLYVYEGFYHEILNELERDRVIQDISAWIDRQLATHQST